MGSRGTINSGVQLPGLGSVFRLRTKSLSVCRLKRSCFVHGGNSTSTGKGQLSSFPRKSPPWRPPVSLGSSILMLSVIVAGGGANIQDRNHFLAPALHTH